MAFDDVKEVEAPESPPSRATSSFPFGGRAFLSKGTHFEVSCVRVKAALFV